MAKKLNPEPGAGDGVKEHFDEATHSLAERGRAVADQIPGIVESASGVMEVASSQMDDLSDQGVIAAVALSSGVMIGLFLAGAPRPILALGLLPIAITARAAMQRGVRVSRLVN
jgi:hypothetical protein